MYNVQFILYSITIIVLLEALWLTTRPPAEREAGLPSPIMNASVILECGGALHVHVHVYTSVYDVSTSSPSHYLHNDPTLHACTCIHTGSDRHGSGLVCSGITGARGKGHDGGSGGHPPTDPGDGGKARHPALGGHQARAGWCEEPVCA